MHHYIRIPSYGRSKVAIIFETQSVMANVFRCINRFCHGANTELLQHMLLRLSMYILQELVERCRDLSFVVHIKLIPEFFCKSCKRLQLFFVWCIMDSIGKGDRL